ncbi:hypothetical protein GIB67_030797 [Kingdonia uniflora]|uniref:Nop domain-containing protein n=1 Tax=Kingdonia uniflora TaxID=39325 RepID=A0A7J7L365_9MAGN|nr:hypothetical protein GIB67_030797 [Kingdonia uniflora]
MAAFPESFLDDLDDLSNNKGNLIDGMIIDEALSNDDLGSYVEIIQKVDETLQKTSDLLNGDLVLEEYELIVACNALTVDMDNEIHRVHSFLRNNYSVKFPKLESLVHHPIDYARVVKKIGNETDMTRVDLQGLLSSAIIMVVSVIASTTCGRPLPEETLEKTIDVCNRSIALDSAKKKVYDFLDSRMVYTAPNLSAIVGSAVAAKLLSSAGGLSEFVKMPDDTVRHLGTKSTNLAGFSRASSQRDVGYLGETEIYRSAHPSFKKYALKKLASRAVFAGQIDWLKTDLTGETGRTYREEIHNKIVKGKNRLLRSNPKASLFRIPIPKRIEVLTATVNARNVIQQPLRASL